MYVLIMLSSNMEKERKIPQTILGNFQGAVYFLFIAHELFYQYLT